jgi:serine/threonine protein kinase
MNVLQPGNLIGRYEIVELLGQGGFTSVYLARDPELQRKVAIKIGNTAEAQVGSLLNEAQILADLQHPSLLTVFDLGREGDLPYLVYEHLPGSLDKEVRHSPSSLSPERIVDIVIHVADALDFVHRRGYLHRNIKPKVILLDGIGQPRLSGFEIAVQQEALLPDHTAGTTHYMAPEQFGGERVGPHSDVWGLGVTMYELLTRQLPFKGETMAGLYAAVTDGEIPPMPTESHVPAALEKICLKCLARNPDQRYATASLLAADLRKFRSGIEPQKQKQVFVSHASKDRDFVEREIIATLEKNGIATWYSKVDIQSGVEWHRSILQGLQSSDWFLLVMSTKSIVSDWVRDELDWAIDNRLGRLVPVLIEDCDVRELHIRLGRLQHVDFLHDLEQARSRLVATFQETGSAKE